MVLTVAAKANLKPRDLFQQCQLRFVIRFRSVNFFADVERHSEVRPCSRSGRSGAALDEHLVILADASCQSTVQSRTADPRKIRGTGEKSD